MASSEGSSKKRKLFAEGSSPRQSDPKLSPKSYERQLRNLKIQYAIYKEMSRRIDQSEAEYTRVFNYCSGRKKDQCDEKFCQWHDFSPVSQRSGRIPSGGCKPSEEEKNKATLYNKEPLETYFKNRCQHHYDSDSCRKDDLICRWIEERESKDNSAKKRSRCRLKENI